MNSEITLHEYHVRYPQTAGIPTLVQSGQIGLLLERQRRKEARKARRRARFKRVLSYLYARSERRRPE